GRGKDFRLCEYFDYVAGTSTGAIIAACLSWGMSVDEIRKFYLESGKDMFDKAGLLDRYYRFKYEDNKIAKKLQEVFGRQTTLGSQKLQTLLMMVMR
ncbi:MAG: patatin-like phospholipase family protein, partial [Nitrospira sp.]|nr:patatin-like phospholipase family protein [Nitrospira sp.]